MTYRLIGLMSIVLLISLGASAFMMGQQQQQVMDEVARTVSDVGRATLATFEFKGAPAAVFTDTWTSQTGVPDGLHRQREIRVLSSSEGNGVDTEHTTTVWASKGEDVSGLCADTRPGSCVVLMAEGEGEGVSRVIQIEQIRAEDGPGDGLFLRIPTVMSRVHAQGHLVHEDESVAAVPGGPPGAATSRREEFVVEVPTSKFGEIFTGFRSKSLFIFLGVFVLGTALSAGAAARFTRPIRSLDNAIRRLSAGNLDVEVNTSGNDEVARLGSAFNDMARSLRAARERAREVQRREKLSALGRLAAGVAHDVRNPLHSVGLTLQNLQETCRPEASARAAEFDRSLGIIREEIHRLDRLVENFLTFARTDRRDRYDLDLREVVRDTARLVEQEAARRGIEIDVRADDDVGPVAVDAESIRSSLLNLVLNSFEAMPDGGRVEFRVRRENGHVLLDVADTGHGIREEDQDKVFDFAFTTRESGHGLGLAMVHQVVVEEHGGRVSLESRPGEGTRITLSFPEERGAGAGA